MHRSPPSRAERRPLGDGGGNRRGTDAPDETSNVDRARRDVDGVRWIPWPDRCNPSWVPRARTTECTARNRRLRDASRLALRRVCSGSATEVASVISAISDISPAKMLFLPRSSPLRLPLTSHVSPLGFCLPYLSPIPPRPFDDYAINPCSLCASFSFRQGHPVTSIVSFFFFSFSFFLFF